MDENCMPKQAYPMLPYVDSAGKSNWMTKLRLLLHETGFGHVWLTQGTVDEQHFLRIFRD